MPETTTEAELAELAIAVYLEELATDQRVLYVGDPQSPGPERLAKVARSVELVSPRARARGTRRGGRVRSRRWPSDDETGRWDLVVIPDLAASGLHGDDRLEQVSEWLDADGVLVAGAEASEHGLSYEALFDLLQDLFDSVRMVGQARFRGFSLVDFDPPGDLEVTFDGSLLDGGGERAARYLALCSDEDVVLDSYAVVQVPAASVAQARAPEPAPAPDSDGRVSELTERIREQQDALDAANVHAEGLERALESAREELEANAGDADATAELKRQRDRARVELSEARESRNELRHRVDELEAALAAEETEQSYDEEYARLETLLRESGRDLTQLRNELERRAVLVRDLVEELGEARSAAPAAPAAPVLDVRETVDWSADQMQRALQDQVADAVQRAVAAEADKAELGFRLDELRGQLAVAEQHHEQDLEEMRRMEAALRGTVRGLNARLAEVTELYQLAQARLQLLEDDRLAAREQAQGLERELAEARDRLELEIARQSTTRSVQGVSDTLRPMGEAVTIVATPGSAEQAALREGQLMGALMRCQEEATQLAVERQQALAAAEEAAAARLELVEQVDGMRRGFELRLAEMGAELDAAGAEAERALVRSGELAARLESMERAEARLRGELKGTQLRLADREQAVKALVADADEGAERAPDVEYEAMREEMQTVRRESESLRLRLEEAARAEEEVAELRAKLEQRATLEAEADALRSQVETSGRAVAEVVALRAELEEVRASVPPPAPDADEADAAPTPAVVAAPARDAGARDAMIARLQRELADAIGRYRDLEARLADASASLLQQKDRVVSAKIEGEVGQEETIRELAELTDRLEESETDRRAALDALTSVRVILTDLTDGFPQGADDGAPLASGSGEIRTLRDRLSKLDELASDRELLLRSLTAQLQERDDRIRALESFDPQDQDDPEALKVRLLELEERAARLAEELENERQARRSDDR